VDAYNQSASGGAANGAPYQTIDSLARLFVLFIVHQPDLPNGEANSGRKAILVQILSVITLVMVHSHEQNRTDFSQKPFFRLFSSMLYGFETQKEQLESMYPYVMICFG
jgi:CCR4-NOT transcription complex subunit 1